MKRSPDMFIFTREFGVRLRDLRLKAGLTQLALAQKLAGIAQVILSGESGFSFSRIRTPPPPPDS